MKRLLCLLALFLAGCATSPQPAADVRSGLLPAGTHGRLTQRTMRPQFLTIHSTGNRGATARNHARLLLGPGIRSKNNPRFGRSGWVVWHYTVDDQETWQHLLPTEQGDHADYGGGGDTRSIGIEICEFASPARQAAALDRGARLAGRLARQYGIPRRNIVPHKHWPRWDFAHGKPCPRILLDRDPQAPGGYRLGARWEGFLDRVERYR